MRRVAVMQGRLLPPCPGRFQAFPGEAWTEEFPAAVEAGFDAIELIWDDHRRDANPLASDEGVQRLRALAERHGVATASVCADAFMERPVPGVSDEARAERLRELEALLQRGRAAGVERVVLPFVDASALRTAADRAVAVEWVSAALPAARANEVELHLETDLDPADFAALLDALDDPLVRVNYDTGNSGALGYDHREELAAYGERIGSVHIKDRLRGGGTVPPGEGDADLRGALAALRELGYSGDVVLQVARGVPGDEVAWLRGHLRTVLDDYGGLG
jgi:L-ribulose-5-phosphate 3-epimerase